MNHYIDCSFVLITCNKIYYLYVSIMKKYILILLILSTTILWGCGQKAMSNDEVIKQVKLCKDNWLSASVIWNFLTNDIHRIQCMP